MWFPLDWTIDSAHGLGVGKIYMLCQGDMLSVKSKVDNLDSWALLLY